MKRWAVMLWLCATLVEGAEAPNPAGLPPIPPPAPSPLEKFRGWLSLPEAEREKAIAEYPEEKQKVLREKLRAYAVLPAPQRDRRLNMLELRWYLRPLMNLPAGQREAHLLAVPVPLQPMVMDRLQAWDKLDAETRAELLANEERKELVMAYFAQIRRGIPQTQIFSQLSHTNRDRLREALAVWNRRPEELERKAAQIATFFETQPAAQAKTLSVLSAAEQAEIQRTLDLFSRLPIEQRRLCVNSFRKFAAMSAEERNQFLRNAARWRELTPRERETWKELVTKLPPMPPEPEPEPAPMPRAGASIPNRLAKVAGP